MLKYTFGLIYHIYISFPELNRPGHSGNKKKQQNGSKVVLAYGSFYHVSRVNKRGRGGLDG